MIRRVVAVAMLTLVACSSPPAATPVTTSIVTTTTTSAFAAELTGTWETDAFRRVSGDVLANIPVELESESWSITPDSGCPGANCVYRLVTLPLETEGGELVMELRPEADTWVATIDWVSSCINPDTGAVTVAEASNVHGIYTVRLTEDAQGPKLDIAFVWDGEPTPEAIEEDCLIRQAEFEAEARPSAQDG